MTGGGAAPPASPRRPGSRALQTLQLLLTACLLWLLLRHVTWDDLVQMRDRVAPGFIGVAALLTIATGLCGAVSLLVLFDLHGSARQRLQFAFDYLYVQALCQLTPAQMGEAALPYVASRGRYQPGEIAAALLVQRFAALLIVVVAALLGAGRWASAGTLWAVAGTVLLGCVLLALLISHAGVRGWINAQVGRRFGPILAGFYDAWRAMVRERPARLMLHLALMVLRFGLSVAGGYAMFQAFAIQVPFGELMALTALAILAGLAPVTINGVGVTEGVFVLALSGYGHGAEVVVASCLAGRVMTALVMAGVAAAHALVAPAPAADDKRMAR